MNDFVRDLFIRGDDSIPIAAEILAGGCVSISLYNRSWQPGSS